MKRKRGPREVLNMRDLEDGDVIVLRVIEKEDDERSEEIVGDLSKLLSQVNPEADVAIIKLFPGENLEFMDEDDMRRFGWKRA